MNLGNVVKVWQVADQEEEQLTVAEVVETPASPVAVDDRPDRSEEPMPALEVES